MALVSLIARRKRLLGLDRKLGLISTLFVMSTSGVFGGGASDQAECRRCCFEGRSVMYASTTLTKSLRFCPFPAPRRSSVPLNLGSSYMSWTALLATFRLARRLSGQYDATSPCRIP